jgi:N-dimethylarginine dimethylaminohydrolase
MDTMSVTTLAPSGSDTTRGLARLLTCPPTFFGVAYRINPWMDPSRPADPERATAQWERMVETYRQAGHEVTVADAVPGLPDMVFTANAGVVHGGRVLLARFRYPERAPEAAAYAGVFRAAGYTDITPATWVNEGEGDYLHAAGVVLGASGFRTDPRSHDEVAEFTGLTVVGLRLVDPRFYHLDTALAVVDEGLVAYWPGAFDRDSAGVLGDLFPDAVIATEEDAVAFGLNAWSDGHTVVLSRGADHLRAALGERGLATVELDTTELQRAGGSVKCCTLELR